MGHSIGPKFGVIGSKKKEERERERERERDKESKRSKHMYTPPHTHPHTFTHIHTHNPGKYPKLSLMDGEAEEKPAIFSNGFAFQDIRRYAKTPKGWIRIGSLYLDNGPRYLDIEIISCKKRREVVELNPSWISQ